MRFDPCILSRNPAARRRYLDIMQAALDAVDPYAAVRAHLRVEDGTLWAGDRSFALNAFRRIVVIGAGKAGAPMARAVESVLGDAITGPLAPPRRPEGASMTEFLDRFGDHVSTPLSDFILRCSLQITLLFNRRL